MWQINEVVLFDNDPYRILAIEDGQVVWMQISADKGVPQARAELLLMQYLDEGRLVRTDDPYVHLDLEEPSVKWHTEFGHLNRGDMLTSEQHRCSNEKKKF